VRDEVFGGQDTQRRQMLMEQLRELVEAEFQQIFVISHTDDVIDHCSLHIEVTREDGGEHGEGSQRGEGQAPRLPGPGVSSPSM
jgi:DNA repair exonuclease SbcCD ATPase subunit